MNEALLYIRKHKGVVAFVGFFALILALDQVFGWSRVLAGEEIIQSMHALLEQNYWLAVGIYLVVTIVGTVVLALPGALFAITAAVLFGPVEGTLWCVVAATVGACGAFMVGRYFLKASVKPWVCKNDAIRKLLFENAGENAVMLLALTRLVPLFPFNVQNFAYGVTDIRFSTYAWCTLIFLTPGTALYTFATAGLFDSQDRWIYLGFAFLLLLFTLAVGAVLRNRDLLIRIEKAHYPFKNWRHAQKSVFFPGCSVQGLFPDTADAIARLLKDSANVGVVYDCCGKPLEERGMDCESRVLEKLEGRLSQHGVTELICACPNCYYYLRPRLQSIRVVSVYQKLDELGLLPVGAIDFACSVYPPCPDKVSLAWYLELEHVFSEAPEVLRKTPCCGLGKPGIGKSGKELSKMAKACLGDGVTYTYCASCAGCLSRNVEENQKVGYVLSDVAGVEEQPRLNRSALFRMKAALR